MAAIFWMGCERERAQSDCMRRAPLEKSRDGLVKGHNSSHSSAKCYGFAIVQAVSEFRLSCLGFRGFVGSPYLIAERRQPKMSLTV